MQVTGPLPDWHDHQGLLKHLLILDPGKPMAEAEIAVVTAGRSTSVASLSMG